jgi:PAS domain S-box-containing protein
MTTISLWLLSLLGLSSFLSLWLYYRFVRSEQRLARFEEAARISRDSLSLLEHRHDEVVNDRRQTEVKLRGYLELLDTLINTIPNPIYFKDADGVYRGCNRAFSKEVLGLSRDQIIGRRNQELGAQMPLDLASVIQKHENTITDRRGMHSFEAEVPCADGRNRVFHFGIAAVHNDGGPWTGSVGVMVDLTDKNRAADDRIQKEKFQGVLETAGAVCHELNQPLQALSGYAELLQMDSEANRQVFSLAQQILDQVERLADITGKLQNLTRYETITYRNQSRIIDIHRSSEPDACKRGRKSQPTAPTTP